MTNLDLKFVRITKYIMKRGHSTSLLIVYLCLFSENFKQKFKNLKL